jgi:EAL domain-containing protein (putative c-di-GMP-specific phosphodiesterase class I)
MVSPAKFIPIAEESGLILPIGDATIKEACRGLRRLRMVDPTVTMSVNLSVHQFRRPNLVGHIQRLIVEGGVAPDALTLELTESALMQDTRAATRALLELRALGLRISVDDFGTGYSSLSYLHRFPFSALKVDRSFVMNLGPDRQSTEIVRTIVTLAHALNLSAIAEGVETPGQLERLRSFRCDGAQGFLFAKAIPLAEAELLVAAQPRW